MKSILSTKSGDVILRPATPGDAQGYREIRLEALRNYPLAFGSDYEETLTQPDSFWQKRVQMDDEWDALFLAEQDGTLIGTTGIYRDKGRKRQHAAQVWGVYVREGWRGLRIADELIRLCLDWGRRHGVVIARLGVASTNTSAIRCYERCGFSNYGIEHKSIFQDGVYHDEYLMECMLDETKL